MGQLLRQLDKNVRFAMVFLLAAMGAALVAILMFLLFRVSVGAGGLTFLVPLIAGLFAGQWHFQDHGLPTQKEMWMESIVFGGISVGVGLLMSALVLTSPRNTELLFSIPIWGWGAGLIGFFAVMTLGVRLGFGIGVKSEANKGQR